IALVDGRFVLVLPDIGVGTAGAPTFDFVEFVGLDRGIVVTPVVLRTGGFVRARTGVAGCRRDRLGFAFARNGVHLVGDRFVVFIGWFRSDFFDFLWCASLAVIDTLAFARPFEVAGSAPEVGVVLAFRRAVMHHAPVDVDEHRPRSGFDVPPTVITLPRVDHQRPPIESASRAVSLSWSTSPTRTGPRQFRVMIRPR